MNKLVRKLSLLIIVVFIGCEDNNNDDNKMEIIEIVTDNISEGTYYFNFVSGKKDNSQWHLVYQNLDAGQGFKMPSISINNSVMLAIDNSIKFEEIEHSPSSSAFTPESGRMKYQGSNAVLNYNMTTHKVTTSTDNYIIYDTVTHKVFKIYFNEYNSGVVSFKYAELSK